jgi:mannose-6-phosphate isomerase
MWYIMQADQDARIIVGFKEDSNAEVFRKLERQTLLSILDSVNVKEGDVFSRNRDGTLYGAGYLPKFSKLLTHRLYDFDRVDAQGNTRELHVDLALEAINYNRVDTE